MPDEHESAVAAWLDLPETQREIVIARRRLDLAGGDAMPILLALLVEILASLDLYGWPEPPDDDDDEPKEPWRPAA